MKWMMAILVVPAVALLASSGARGPTPPASETGGGGTGKVQAIETEEAMIDRYTRGVAGSVHDFTGPLGTPGDACSACHIPHVHAIRPTTQPATQPAAEMFFIEGQRRVFETDRYTPGPTSLICLGCHDGTVATSTIGSAHALLAGVREGFAVPDGFVWRDHPIGVPYPNDRREYHPVSRVLARGRIRLPEGRLECISCHDPHHAAGAEPMLVMSNRRSALCLECHIK